VQVPRVYKQSELRDSGLVERTETKLDDYMLGDNKPIEETI
jgi:hypothetical protein